MKIAAGATVLGLGGLGGYALAANDGQPASAGAATAEEQANPRAQTEVVHRTIHVRARGRSEKAAGAAGSSVVGTAGAPVNDLSSSYEGEDYEEVESDEHESEDLGDLGEPESEIEDADD
jgi:hypothetical protein